MESYFAGVPDDWQCENQKLSPVIREQERNRDLKWDDVIQKSILDNENGTSEADGATTVLLLLLVLIEY